MFWLQTSSLFGDLRIPEPTPSEGVRCLGEASSEELLALAKQVRSSLQETRFVPARGSTGVAEDADCGAHLLSVRTACGSRDNTMELTVRQQGLVRLQDGFAGVTEVEGNKTTWHRQVNFRPESAANVDAGIMTFADSEHVREDGLDGSYLEEWERLPESVGPTWGFRLARELHTQKHRKYNNI